MATETEKRTETFVKLSKAEMRTIITALTIMETDILRDARQKARYRELHHRMLKILAEREGIDVQA